MFKITGRDALPEYTSTNPSAEFKKYDTKDYKEQQFSAIYINISKNLI